MYRFFICFFLLPFIVAAQPDRINQLNLSSFSKRNYSAPHTSASVSERSHPDFGILPTSNLPCEYCYEELSARSATSRKYIAINGGVRKVYHQYAASPINYRDKNGYFRSIETKLTPSSKQQVIFAAYQQPVPVEIVPVQRKTSLWIEGKEFVFNKNIRLIHRSTSGIDSSLGEGNWNAFSVGDNGLCFADFYPGIDLLFVAREGELESGFLIKNKLSFSDGELLLIAEMRLPLGIEISSNKRNELSEMRHERFLITDNSGVPQAELRNCFAFDNRQGVLPLKSAVNENTLLVSCPVEWLNAPSRSYPVHLDPVVTTQGVLPNGVGGVEGSKYSAICWTNGCDYTLSVPTPANAKLTGVFTSFEYYAVTGACQAQDGGYSVQLAGCTAPAAAPGVFTCASASTNYYCTAVNVDITNDVAACLPPDQCASQQLGFTLHFYRCNNDTSTTCSENCIRASQPWVITLEGRDLELPFITPDQQLCNGNRAALQAVPQFGIGPYAYSWSNGSLTDTTSVSPPATTSYTVTVTDDCGTTRTATSTVNIIQNANPGFVASANTVCINEQFTVTGNGGASPTAYSWLAPGSNAPGGIISGANAAVLQYSIPGTYSVTLRYQSGGCSSDSTLQITVNAPSPVEASLVSFPSGSVCPGDTLTYTVSTINAGSTPSITFLVNGTVQQAGSNAVFSSNQLQSGDLVQAVVTGTGTCLSSATDTASLFAVVSGAVTPSVSLSTDVDPCAGNTVTFTASPVNGGSNPTFQWSVNGVLIPSATAVDFTLTLSGTDSLVSVSLTSSLNCVTTPFATALLSIGNATIASVAISSTNGDTLCFGELVTVVANPVNGGALPTYQWLLNGVITPDSGAVFTSTNLQAADQLQVVMTSNAACAGASSVSSNLIVFDVFPPITMLVFGASPVCEGQSVTLSAQAFGGDGGPYTYSWNNSIVAGNSFTFVPEASQYIYVEASDDCGGSPLLDSTYVLVKPKPTAAFSFSPNNPSSLDPVVEFTDRSQGASNVRWYFGDGDSSSVRYPVHSYDQSGTYVVTQLVTAPNGCFDTLAYTLIVSEDIALYFPSAFTPNDDDKNESWFPYGVPGIKYNFVIVDRWGKAVFEGDQDNPWPGTFMKSSSVVPEGVYTFVVTMDDSRFANKSFTGKVTLVR